MIDLRIAGLDLDTFERADTVRDAVVSRLLVIGEALNWIRRHDPATVQGVPHLDEIVAMRHRLVHAYAEIDDEIVWDAAVSKLGPLRERLDALLGERPNE